MSERDRREIEARLQAAFDRFNEAVIAGEEPTPPLFLEALDAEGLELSVTGSHVESTDQAAQAGRRGRSAWAGRAQGLIPKRARGSL